ncbi:hypothetical protein LEP1GSC170_4047 [Leptospira interrogans serovar Bataviae str. HAI135]|nr:hypothetical protein LEP1GSC170_4047 [Leptospira interrogans serovar Bataviae str. HAI135]
MKFASDSPQFSYIELTLNRKKFFNFLKPEISTFEELICKTVITQNYITNHLEFACELLLRR